MKVNFFEMMQGKKIICFGAGAYFLDFMQKVCINEQLIPMPSYVCDNDVFKQGTTLFGVKILPPSELLKEDIYNTVVIATARNFHTIFGEVLEISGGAYFYILDGYALTSNLYIERNYKSFQDVNGLLQDKHSRDCLDGIMEGHRIGNLYNPEIYTTHAYYGNDIIPGLDENDRVVLGGAFDGKHIEAALKLNKNVRLDAFEPNPECTKALKIKYKNFNNIIIHDEALFDGSSLMHLDNHARQSPKILTNSSYGRIESAGWGVSANSDKNTNIKNDTYTILTEKVSTTKMDSIIKDRVTLIALDIEGVELAALKGAEKIISTYKPKLAICLYHNIEDFITIPNYLNDLNLGYKFYIRHHSCFFCETVLYAI